LLELRRAGPPGLRPLALEARLLLAQHNVSRLLGRLAAQGLIERRPAPDDRRGQVITVTDAGRDLLARMWPVYGAAVERHVGARLGEAEAARLGDLLARLTGR
jgi:DNA-binding MarR family transcriptional regulator